VRSVTNQQQAIACPIANEPDNPFQREERREVLQVVRELAEDRVELAYTVGDE
jgi:hypothetical protein